MQFGAVFHENVLVSVSNCIDLWGPAPGVTWFHECQKVKTMAMTTGVTTGDANDHMVLRVGAVTQTQGQVWI